MSYDSFLESHILAFSFLMQRTNKSTQTCERITNAKNSSRQSKTNAECLKKQDMKKHCILNETTKSVMYVYFPG